MFKIIGKAIKWCFFLTLIGMAGALCGGLVAGFMSGLTGVDFSGDGLSSMFTLGFLIIAIVKEVKKSKAGRKTSAKKVAEEKEIRYMNKASEEGKRNAGSRECKPEEKAVAKDFEGNPVAKKLDQCGKSLELQAMLIGKASTAATVRSIASTMRKIAIDVNEDPRDRGKVRGLSDTCGDLVEGLVSKYIKLERQNQESENIKTALYQIELALGSTDQALKQLLDDLFANDNVEIATDIAVLDKMLQASRQENTLKM